MQRTHQQEKEPNPTPKQQKTPPAPAFLRHFHAFPTSPAPPPSYNLPSLLFPAWRKVEFVRIDQLQALLTNPTNVRTSPARGVQSARTEQQSSVRQPGCWDLFRPSSDHPHIRSTVYLRFGTTGKKGLRMAFSWSEKGFP